MVKRICGRCQTHNAAAAGQFDLLVRSVRLGEDEEYECQGCNSIDIFFSPESGPGSAFRSVVN